MPITFHIPGALRMYCNGLHRVEMESSAATVQEALHALFEKYPGIRDRVVNEQGRLREHINIFVGEEDIRYTGEFSTPVSPGLEISIIPAVSGG